MQSMINKLNVVPVQQLLANTLSLHNYIRYLIKHTNLWQFNPNCKQELDVYDFGTLSQYVTHYTVKMIKLFKIKERHMGNITNLYGNTSLSQILYHLGVVGEILDAASVCPGAFYCWDREDRVNEAAPKCSFGKFDSKQNRKSVGNPVHSKQRKHTIAVRSRQRIQRQQIQHATTNTQICIKNGQQKH
ncbi:hypothetical protein LXL04_012847 [Taraxacum kok-saghyz]